MGIDMNDVTGAIEIDGWGGPDEKLVVFVKAPTYGGLKRIRAERERINEEAHTAQAALPEIPEAGDEEGVDDAATRARLARERVAAIDNLNLDAAVRLWRFIMFGDDTFKGLADPKPPEDADEWPSGLIVDSRRFNYDSAGKLIIDDQVIPLIDKAFNHWGKARSRSGPRA